MSLSVHPLCLGRALVDTSFVVWGMTPGTPVKIPVSAYLILGGAEPVLVDAGFRDGPALSAATGFTFSQAEDETLEAGLARHGLEAADIGVLVLTHLHADHTGQVPLLPNARIVVQRRELQYAAAPLFPAPFFDRVDTAALVGPLFDRIEFLEGDADILPGVRGVLTGGHSPGHQLVEVDLDSGLAVITGDLVYLAEPGLTMQIPPGYVTDLAETMLGLARIKRDAVHALPMHDGAVYDRYPEGVR